MTATPPNPMAAVEALLANPAASGLFLTALADDSPLTSLGAKPGDILTHVGETPVGDLRTFLEAMRSSGEDDTTRAIRARTADGAEVTWTVPTPLRGYSSCAVVAGKPAWTPRPDTEYEPDFTGLADGTEIWLRCSFGEEPAGFERLRVEHDGDLLRIDTLFRIGGADPEHGEWDYRTRGRSAHRADRWLSLVETAFREGAPDGEVSSGDVKMGDDGVWRGIHGAEAKPVEFPAASPHAITPYTIMMLPLTMPLAEGACLTVCVAGEGTGVVSSRARLECEGRRDVELPGGTSAAWCFRWRHYGEFGEEERFWVSDDRRLVRVDWGANYGGCWAVLVDAGRVLDGVPEHVRVE